MKLYIDITTSMSSSLSISVLFISLVQSVNGIQFLNTNSLSLLSRFSGGGGGGGGTGAIVIVTLTSRHASHASL